MKIATLFKSLSKSLLLLTFFTPFIVTTFSVFPFEYGKTIFYTVLIQFAAIFFGLYLIFDFDNAYAEIKSHFSGKRNWVLWAGILFLLSMTISTIFAAVPYISFWGNVDRNEGLIAFLYYGSFVFLSYILFSKFDWYLYFCGLLISVILLCVVGWMQYLGIDGNLIINIRKQAQPGSFAGNPVFLSSFLITFLLYAAALFSIADLRKKLFISIPVSLLVISTILLTGIRGELIGLTTAVIILVSFGIFKGSNRKIRIIASVAMVSLIVFIGVFLLTKSNPVWKSIPTVKRFATLTSQSNSFVVRVITSEAAIKGFKERWLAGWGPEGFNIVFNKYGSGRVADYGDDWFDRTHNKVLDIAIYQGLIGLITYFSLLGVLVYTFRKKILFVALLVAYFVQSLFIFDTNLTYLVVCAVIAFAAQTFVDIENNEEKQLKIIYLLNWKKRLIQAVTAVVISGIFFVFISVTLLSVKQQLIFGKVLNLPRFEDRAALLHDLFYPFNSTQPRVRMFINQMLRDWRTIGRPGGVEVILLGIDALKETIKYDPLEVRYHMRLAEAYLELSSVDKKYLEMGEEFARQGIAAAPQQQKLYYLLNFILSREGSYDEAIDIAKRAVDIGPQNARSQLYLSLTYFAASDPQVNPFYDPADKKFVIYKKEAVETLYKTLDLAATGPNGKVLNSNGNVGDVSFRLFEKSDFNNLLLLLSRQGDYDRLLKTAEIGLLVHPGDQVMYQYMLAVYTQFKNTDKFVETIGRMKNAPFAWQLPLDQWAELAKKGEWDVIKKQDFIARFLVIFVPSNSAGAASSI